VSAELVPAGRFDVAWPGEAARAARNLTEIWLMSFRSQNTRVAYRRDLTGWLAFCDRLGVRPADAKMAHVDLWIEAQRTEGCAEASIARRVSALSSWYRYLIDNTGADPTPLATYNPAKTRAKPKIDPDYTPTVGLSTAEADRLIEAADMHSLTAAALVRLLLTNGLRIGSVMDAQVSDLGHDRGHRVLTLRVKGGTTDRVPIPPFTATAIDAMLADHGDPADGPLFVTSRGRPLYETWAWRLIRKLAVWAAVAQAAKLSPHGLRHTAITELIDSGVSLLDAQKFARHKDPRTTRRYYHGLDNLDRHGAYGLAARFGHGK
jgi:site-specific recombinase XerD